MIRAVALSYSPVVTLQEPDNKNLFTNKRPQVNLYCIYPVELQVPDIYSTPTPTLNLKIKCSCSQTTADRGFKAYIHYRVQVPALLFYPPLSLTLSLTLTLRTTLTLRLTLTLTVSRPNPTANPRLY